MPTARCGARACMKLLVGLVLWSIMTGLAYITDNFAEFFATRLGLGIGQAMCNPAALAMIGDYFPPKRLAIASSVYNFGIYIGGGLSASLGVTIADHVGWRWTFAIFALAGIVLFIVAAVALREPRRDAYGRNRNKQPALLSLSRTVNYLSTLDSAWIIGVAAGVRSFASYAFGGFVPGYIYALYGISTRTSLYYALVTSVGGVLASLLGGLITNFWVRHNPRAPVYVCALGTLLACPFVFLFIFSGDIVGATNDRSYSLCMVCLFLAYVTGESWGGPAASVYQSILPANMLASGLALYFFILTLIGSAGPEVLGAFDPSRQCAAQKWPLALTICLAYVISALGFLAAGPFLKGDLERKTQFESVGGHPRVTRLRRIVYATAAMLLFSLTGVLIAISFALQNPCSPGAPQPPLPTSTPTPKPTPPPTRPAWMP